MNCGALLPRAPQRQRGANKLISSQTFPLAALQYFHVCGRPQLDAVIQRELSRTGLSDDVQYHQVPFMDIRLKSDKSNIKSKLYWKTSKKKCYDWNAHDIPVLFWDTVDFISCGNVLLSDFECGTVSSASSVISLEVCSDLRCQKSVMSISRRACRCGGVFFYFYFLDAGERCLPFCCHHSFGKRQTLTSITRHHMVNASVLIRLQRGASKSKRLNYGYSLMLFQVCLPLLNLRTSEKNGLLFPF